MALGELADHIESTHHVYVATEMPRLEALAEKVAEVHGASDTRLGELKDVVHALARELAPHMMKEEQILFPIVRKLALSDTPIETPFGSLANPIAAMEADHDNAGGNLGRMRELTDNYVAPDWACNTYRALLDGLREFELDLHQHIHKENNILFPRALELEQRES
jgi:regulator of cell morphogenesis and NO signaling